MYCTAYRSGAGGLLSPRGCFFNNMFVVDVSRSVKSVRGRGGGGNEGARFLIVDSVGRERYHLLT